MRHRSTSEYHSCRCCTLLSSFAAGQGCQTRSVDSRCATCFDVDRASVVPSQDYVGRDTSDCQCDSILYFDADPSDAYDGLLCQPLGEGCATGDNMFGSAERAQPCTSCLDPDRAEPDRPAPYAQVSVSVAA